MFLFPNDKRLYPRLRLTALIWLLAAVLSADAASAQDRETDRATDRSLERYHLEQRAKAEAWAERNSLPPRIIQSDGTAVEITGIDEGIPLYLTTYNAVAAATTRTNQVYPGGPLGLNLTGNGMVVGIWDEGHVLASHIEVEGRVHHRDNASVSFHATHVGGTLIASGINPEARGMAYRGQLWSYDWNNDTGEMNAAAGNGLLVSNHSYGFITGWHWGDLEQEGNRWYWFGDPAISRDEDYRFGRYVTISAQWDNMAFNNPYLLPVVAAGNDRNVRGPARGDLFRGFDARGDWRWYSTVNDFHPPPNGHPHGFNTVGDRAIAKNTLVVGSVHDRPDGEDDIRLSSFSSFGPTDDGRVKPDVLGNGETLVSLSNQSTSAYAAIRGTSMATPNVSGSLILLQEHYQNQEQESMRAATLKALAIHTAEDAGTPGPNYQYGWGLLNTAAAADLITSLPANRLQIQEHELSNGATFEQTAHVSSPSELRVTLSWTDPPATVLPVTGPESLNDRTPRLTNDLDLRIISVETGEVTLPWILNPNDPSAPALRGDNVVDNVEQVLVEMADPGEYIIRVTHKGTLRQTDTQPFSLIVTGAVDRVRLLALTAPGSFATIDAVTLEWQTLFERTDGRLIVERSRVTQEMDGSLTEHDPEVVGVLELEGLSESPQPYEFEDPFVPAGRYIYRLYVDIPDEEPYVELTFTVDVPAPPQYRLISNYPNPFTDFTRIRLDLPGSTHVLVEIFDVLGRRIETVVDGELPAARHDFSVSAGDWASGVYLLRIITREGTLTRKIMKAE